MCRLTLKKSLSVARSFKLVYFYEPKKKSIRQISLLDLHIYHRTDHLVNAMLGHETFHQEGLFHEEERSLH